MAKERKKLDAAGVILHLVSFGVVAVVITTWFGSTCFSVLAISREPLVGSRIREARIDIEHQRSPFPNCPAARSAAEADPPNSVKLTILIPSAARDLSTSETELPGFLSFGNFGTHCGRELSQPIAESQDVLPTQLAPTDEVPSIRVHELRQPTFPTKAIAELVSVSRSASLTPSPAVSILYKGGEQGSLSAELDQDAMAAQSAAMIKLVQSEPSGEHPLRSKAAFQNRIRKECGPISDRELHYQCILSFRFHYR